jgi:hypothetical protein
MLLVKLFGELLEERPSLSCEIPDTGDDDDVSDAVYDERFSIGGCRCDKMWPSWNESFEGDISACNGGKKKFIDFLLSCLTSFHEPNEMEIEFSSSKAERRKQREKRER